jgi:uncharacterized protein YktA (UPF0223 family)
LKYNLPISEYWSIELVAKYIFVPNMRKSYSRNIYTTQACDKEYAGFWLVVNTLKSEILCDLIDTILK